MEYGDVLLTLAEVSVAFAGFAGVVAVFGRNDPATWTFADRSRFYSLVSTSLSVVFLSLVPIALAALEIPVSTVWRLTSGLFLVYLGTSLVVWFRQFCAASDQERLVVSSLVLWGVMLCDAVILGLLTYDMILGAAVGPYLLALILMAGQSAFYFARLLVLSFGTRRAP